ncbi:DegT/DnrJ/EryC1/StrS family aminotransferase [bacterium]|nr:DegT/DnrJ/EryC1/StrS family aminotransferase [bacterium]
MPKLAILGGTPVREKPFSPWPIWREKDVEAVGEVIKSGKWGTRGPKVEEFERKFAEYCQCKFCVSVTSGTTALYLALWIAGVEPGDEVIVPPYTFIATANAAAMLGAIPVFADVDLDSCCLDPYSAEALITPRTKAIIPVHLAGEPANMDYFQLIKEKYGIAIIEDCAHAHGSEWRGKRVGSLGDVGAFSFQESKNLSSGEGGAVTTNDEELYEYAFSVHHVGRKRIGGAWYEHVILGANMRMTEFQAAILLSQMDKIEDEFRKREENALYLDSLLEKIEGIIPQKRDPRVTRRAYHLYVFRYIAEAFAGVPRDIFLRALSAEGIPCAAGYGLLSDAPVFSEGNFGPFNKLLKGEKLVREPLTNTKILARESVWLFQNMLLEKSDMDDIAEAINKIRENLDELKAYAERG